MTQELLRDRGPVRLAFLAYEGSTPGLELLAALPMFIVGRVLASQLGVDGIAASAVLTGLVCTVGLILVVRRRKIVVVASTDEAVFVLRTSGIRSPRPTRVIETFPRTGSLVFLDAGDQRVVVGGRKYWVDGMNEDVARRMSGS